VFTLVHVPGSVSPKIESHPIGCAAVGFLPGVAHYYRLLLPVFPAVIEQFDLDAYDLVISTSHCAAKSVVAPRRARHLCYCLTPMRYAWDQFEAYFGEHRLGPLAAGMRAALRRLARWDAATSGRPDRYVAISQYVAGRIGRYYNRRSAIVHPPVDTDYFHPTGAPPGPFALVVSALVPYKRVDVAIDACRLAGIPLKIVGQGPERSRLEKIAGRDVEFLGQLPDERVRELYSHAMAVLLTGEEDFGIVPVEAQACGRPVVAIGRGGSAETVLPGVTGLLVNDPTPAGFAAALNQLSSLDLDPSAIRTHAERFSRARFFDQFDAQVHDLLSAAPEAVRW
jgi:glycosyltransferase involved in cell wall biosynthesis